jgi:hypothetical protein
VFGLNFGELFIVGFVFITVVGAPYAGPVGERLVGWLMPKGATVDRDEEASSAEAATDADESEETESEESKEPGG